MSTIPFKCYHGNEIRRLSLPAGVSYSGLMAQLQAAFYIPPTQQLRLRWQDEEGDLVAMTTDAELADAVRSFADRPQGSRKPGEAVKIFLTGQQPTAVHEGVTCDGCETGVTGHRFKCLLCPDYDLCSACMSADCHSQHPMILIRRPGDPGAGFCGFPKMRRGCHGGGGYGGGGGWRRWAGGFPQFREFFAAAAAEAAKAAEAAATAAEAPSDQEATKQAAEASAAHAAAAQEVSMATEPTGQSEATAATAEAAAAAVESGSHGNEPATPPLEPRIARALEHMQAMGFSDDGGWLTRLLLAKDGDICAVLDAIRPAK